MKASEKQIKVMEMCRGQLHFWMTSNDIQSPTHFCDNDEIVSNMTLFDGISELDEQKLRDQLNELLTVIRGIR